jgi:tetratricopeptide (TPR) repeat protein
MNLVSRAAIAAALALCGIGFATSASALAQDSKPEAQPARKFNFTKEEQAALFALQEAVTAKDPAVVATAMTAAQAAAQSADAKYALATLQLQWSGVTGDKAAQAQAVEALIASGGVAAADLPALIKSQVNLALDMKDYPRAEAGLNKLLQSDPNDHQIMLSLARLRYSQKRYADAAPLLEKVISLQKAAGQTVPEQIYRLGLNSAYLARQPEQATKLSRELVQAYPNSENWRSALLMYREFNKPDKSTELDALRLMRFTRAISDAGDFYLYADTLNRAGYPGEAKTVLDEGFASNKLSSATPGVSELRSAASSKVAEDRQGLPGQEKSALAAANGTAALSIGDAYLGYGDYAKAVELYRAALAKGSVDANLVNMRLGMALAMAGKKAEAEAAFAAVTGPRAQLAEYFKLWVSQKA